MNKKIILPFVAILVLAVAMVGAASADEVITVDEIEIRGEVVDLTAAQAGPIIWTATNFAAFWYDLDEPAVGSRSTETLTILATDPATTLVTLTGPNADRTLDDNTLVYDTHTAAQVYELSDSTLTNAAGGALTVDGATQYFVEGWMAEKYVAVEDNADKLVKLLVEFEGDDKKTLAAGEAWDIGGGFTLTANQIDLEGDKVWFSLAKDGVELDNEVVSTNTVDRQDSVYVYTADLAGEDDVPVFSCYVDAVFRGTDSNIVQVMYVFLVDNDVLEIDTGTNYGIMEVTTASATQIILENEDSSVDLDTDTTERIMGDMYFKTADDDTAIRFYPFAEKTIGEAPGEADEEEVETPIEVNETAEANVTPTAEVTPTPEPTASPVETVTDDTAADAEETATPKTPGFEAIFAIAGLLAVAYLVLRQRE